MEEINTPKAKNKKRLRMLILLAVILLGVIIGGIFIFIKLSEKDPLSEEQKQAAVEKILGHKARKEEDIPLGNVNYDGQTLSFSYPAQAQVYHYSESSDSTKPKAELEKFSFDMYQPRRDFAVAVYLNSAELPSIDNYPGVQLRRNQAKIYKEAVVKADNRVGISFIKQGEGAEKSAFFLVNGKIYSIAVTGSSLEEVSHLFDQVIGTLKFK
jgi:hypothetical protein